MLEIRKRVLSSDTKKNRGAKAPRFFKLKLFRELTLRLLAPQRQALLRQQARQQLQLRRL